MQKILDDEKRNCLKQNDSLIPNVISVNIMDAQPHSLNLTGGFSEVKLGKCRYILLDNVLYFVVRCG